MAVLLITHLLRWQWVSNGNIYLDRSNLSTRVIVTCFVPGLSNRSSLNHSVRQTVRLQTFVFCHLSPPSPPSPSFHPWGYGTKRAPMTNPREHGKAIKYIIGGSWTRRRRRIWRRRKWREADKLWTLCFPLVKSRRLTRTFVEGKMLLFSVFMLTVNKWEFPTLYSTTVLGHYSLRERGGIFAFFLQISRLFATQQQQHIITNCPLARELTVN